MSKHDLSDYSVEDLTHELMSRANCGAICLQFKRETEDGVFYEYFRQWMGNIHTCVGLLHNMMFNMELDLISGVEDDIDGEDDSDDAGDAYSDFISHEMGRAESDEDDEEVEDFADDEE